MDHVPYRAKVQTIALSQENPSVSTMRELSRKCWRKPLHPAMVLPNAEAPNGGDET